MASYPSPSEGRQTENHNHRKLTNLVTWTTARQASLSITNSWSFLKLVSIESVMPSHHLMVGPCSVNLESNFLLMSGAVFPPCYLPGGKLWWR